MTERWSATVVRVVLAAVIVGAVVVAVFLCLGFGPGQIAAMFSHPVSGGTAPAGQVPAPPFAPPGQAPIGKSFTAIDYAVLVVYLIAMLVIGWIASRRIKTARHYFVGNQKINYVLVGISLLGSYLSALTMMALSGTSYGELDWLYIVQLPCLIITAIVITRVVLPRYRAEGVLSMYEFLERRIHVSVRLIASVAFVVFSVGRMGLVLYLPALAFSTVTGVELWRCIVVTGAVITVYTAMGGIEAVIWNDAIQVAIIVAGAFATLGYMFYDIGVGRFIEVGLTYNKFRYIEPSLNITKITTVWLILETIFQTIRIYGTQQDMTQRYMTTESTAKANRSVWIAILAYIPLGFIFYFIGTGLFAFYAIHPDPNLPSRPDTIYPYFIVNSLPVGVAGLLIAAIFAASMSTIDSLMNSSSTVCVEDFMKRLGRKQRTEAEYLTRARLLTWLWGVLTIVMGLVFAWDSSKYTQIVWGKLMAICTNGMVGLMALAFLPFRINKWAAIIGFAVSYVCLFVMMGANTVGFSVAGLDLSRICLTLTMGYAVNFLLWPVIGNTVCFAVAAAMNGVIAKDTLPEERKAQA